MSTRDAPRQVESLLLKLWRCRGSESAASVEAVCKELVDAAPSDLQSVEMYLPQFAHVSFYSHKEDTYLRLIYTRESPQACFASEKYNFLSPAVRQVIIACADDFKTTAPIERFVLTVCQLSIHLALQFFWMVYTALLENRLKDASSNRATYRRCAKLLLELEQCVVYGGALAAERSVAGGATARQRELLNECVRVANACQELAEKNRTSSDVQAFTIAGTLRKKGGGTSKFGRRTWSNR